MMDLEEAIKHCEEVAKEKEEDAIIYHNCAKYKQNLYEKGLAKNTEKECLECAEEHRQLAEWLKELKSLKEKANDIDEVGMANIKLALNDGATKHIQKICNKSECGKCPYTLKKMSCIFSVCPVDWEVNDDENN